MLTSKQLWVVPFCPAIPVQCAERHSYDIMWHHKGNQICYTYWAIVHTLCNMSALNSPVWSHEVDSDSYFLYNYTTSIIHKDQQGFTTYCRGGSRISKGGGAEGKYQKHLKILICSQMTIAVYFSFFKYFLLFSAPKFTNKFWKGAVAPLVPPLYCKSVPPLYCKKGSCPS